MTTTTVYRLTRSGGTMPDLASFVQRSRSFSAAVKRTPGVALVAKRDERGYSTFLLCPDQASAQAVATALASTVGAKAELTEQPPDLATAKVVGWLEANPSDLAARESQYGGDPSETALAVNQALSPGEWVAISLRAPLTRENRAVRRWFKFRLQGATGTHYSNEAEALVATIFAGGESAGEVKALLPRIAAAIPGFELESVPKTEDHTSVPVGLAVLSIATWLGAWVGLSRLHVHSPAAIAAGIGAVIGLVGLGYASGVLKTYSRRVRQAIDGTGIPPAPAKRALPVQAPRQAKIDQNGKETKASPGSYPLHRSAFVLGSAMCVGVASPHAGTASDVASTRSRPAPSALLGDIGPVVGFADHDGQPVHISDADAYSGVGLIGVPGTGKTEMVQTIYARAVLERVSPSNKPGRPGRAQTLIAFENKGDGAAGYLRWSESLGDKAVLVELGDPDTPAIDILNIPGDAATKTDFFLSTMIYAWGDTQIQGRSSEALSAMIPIAILTPPEIAEAAIGRKANVMEVAHALLGGLGDEMGVRLIRALSESDPNPELADALLRASAFYGAQSTTSSRRTLMESSRNKLDRLLKARSWWDRDRQRYTWDEILDNHLSVVVNTGTTTNGGLVAEDTTKYISAMLAYSLREAIRRRCRNWYAEGRSVSIFADELALWQGTSAEVISWLREQGRSSGVRLVVAAQYPEQLLPEVRSVLLGLGTTIWFRQSNPTVLDEAVRYMNVDGGEWTTADLVNLEAYHAILRATVDQRTQPPVPMRAGYWAGDPVGFRVAQGYPAGSAPVSDDWWADATPAPVSLPDGYDPYATGGQE